MSRYSLAVVLILFFGFASICFGSGLDEFSLTQFVTVQIDGQNFDVYYKLSERRLLGESFRYDIKDDALMSEDSDFFVSGYKSEDSGCQYSKWQIPAPFNIPHELSDRSILIRIAEKPHIEALSDYRNIFSQVYEQIGCIEDIPDEGQNQDQNDK